jgi:hypothetical protein
VAVGNGWKSGVGWSVGRGEGCKAGIAAAGVGVGTIVKLSTRASVPQIISAKLVIWRRIESPSGRRCCKRF